MPGAVNILDKDMFFLFQFTQTYVRLTYDNFTQPIRCDRRLATQSNYEILTNSHH